MSANGLGINWSKKFHQKKLFPYVEHHRPHIEALLAGMSVNSEAPARESYSEFSAFYLSFGVPLAGAKGDVTFTRARDEEKIAAGWLKDEEGVLVAPAAPEGERDDEVGSNDGNHALKTREDREKELGKLTTPKLEALAAALDPPLIFDGDDWTNAKRAAAILDHEFPAAPEGN